MLLPSDRLSTAWVKRLPDVVSALNNGLTSLFGKKKQLSQSKRRLSHKKPSTKSIPDLLDLACEQAVASSSLSRKGYLRLSKLSYN